MIWLKYCRSYFLCLHNKQNKIWHVYNNLIVRTMKHCILYYVFKIIYTEKKKQTTNTFSINYKLISGPSYYEFKPHTRHTMELVMYLLYLLIRNFIRRYNNCCFNSPNEVLSSNFRSEFDGMFIGCGWSFWKIII